MDLLESVIDFVNQDIGAAGSTLSSEVVAGISLGALVLFLILLLLPILSPKVNTRAFLTSFFRGILASAVYLATEHFYKQMEHLGRIYLIGAMLAAIITTLVLVELLVSAGKQKEQRAMRTDIMASIASGMAFSLIVTFVSYALTNLKLFN